MMVETRLDLMLFRCRHRVLDTFLISSPDCLTDLLFWCSIFLSFFQSKMPVHEGEFLFHFLDRLFLEQEVWGWERFTIIITRRGKKVGENGSIPTNQVVTHPGAGMWCCCNGWHHIPSNRTSEQSITLCQHPLIAEDRECKSKEPSLKQRAKVMAKMTRDRHRCYRSCTTATASAL
jgi:hypothetical protein